jgi:putative transposase
MRFSEEQIIGVLKEAEAGAKTADLARRHGVSEATIYNWKAKYGGLEVSEARRLRALEEREREAQAAAGRRDAGQRCAEGSAGKKVVTPAAMREAVAHLQACHGMSERRACRVIGDRKSVRYRSTRDDDADLREKLRELANQRRRFGYRRLHILLRREGVMINRKKTQRIYREEGWRSGGGAAAGVPWARGHLPRCWRCPTSAGAWTSCTTRWRRVAGSACSTWSMT